MRIAHKTVKEQMDAAERISATSRELELRDQLAAEKAARLRAEAEHDRWCVVADEALGRARKAEAESAEARSNVSKALAELGEQVKLRLKAEAGREEARAEIEKFRSEEWVSGAEVGVFQDRVRNDLIRLTGCPENLIDGKGSDAGWEEFTLAEIGQGISFLLDRANELQKERDEARAACAEKHNALVKLREVSVYPGDCENRAFPYKQKSDFLKVMAQVDRALSSDRGKGWLSPEDRATVRKYVDETGDHLDPTCFSGTPNPKCRKCRILALLDGKEAK